VIEILYFDGCPNLEPTVRLAREALAELGVEAEIREVRVQSPEDAERMRFIGSPSVRVNGRDIEPQAEAQTGYALSCRMYADGGVPPKALFIQALREAS
jgi:hypothetical protein